MIPDVVAVRVLHDRIAGAPERIVGRLRHAVAQTRELAVNAVDLVA